MSQTQHVQLQITKLEPEAILPDFAHPGDAGLDLRTIETVTLEPGSRTALRTGLAMAIDHDCVGLIWDKSGRALHDGLTVLAGVIDAGFRGEVAVVVMNVSHQPLTITAGEKIAQLLIQPIIRPTVVEVETLEDTVRAAAGFGSTGL